ncbi:hypothetical protein BDF19DRAFT_148058 [Syncephalis fuscata]|nr:hypothetical protein BDF19DRAFT_148058 [Syncephalis fuscata]
MAPNGIIQTALTRVATAISLSNQQEDATQPDMVNACSSTNDITDIPMISLNSHTSTDIPLLILMEAESGSQSLLTFASLTNPLTDGVNSMTILLQKFRTRGQTYVLERIYGVEEEENTVKVEANSDTLPTTEETGTCVVCIADPSMVAVLPCRHLCLCMECAEELRNRSCFCPICRQAFHTMICIGDQ